MVVLIMSYVVSIYLTDLVHFGTFCLHSNLTSIFSARKSCGEDIKQSLEEVVVPMFCNAASMNATEEQKAKLNKVRLSF